MFLYELTSLPNFSIDKEILDSIFESVSKIVPDKQFGTINIVFIDSDSIQKLNNDFRKKDTPTDVLSFHYHEDFSNLAQADIAWEIVLSESHIVSQWKEYGLWTEKEFYKLVIHSLLHILGYDHEEDSDYQEMNNLEQEIWKKMFEK